MSIATRLHTVGRYLACPYARFSTKLPPEAIRTRPTVEAQDLLDVIHNRIGFLRVPNYVPKEVTRAICLRLDSDFTVRDYENAPGVGKVDGVGTPFFETDQKAPALARYYQTARKSMDVARSLCHPHLSPLDKLRLELDERWSKGATVLNLGSGKMFSGLIRVLNGAVLAHEDKLERDMGCSARSLNYMAQLACNIYLRMPLAGGELARWGISLPDEEYKERTGSTYGIEPASLPKRSISVRPSTGDLIIFNPRFLHSVGAASGETSRVSMSTFVLYQGDDRPLGFWS
ncbi:MAG: 2OG-Fe(II) oxygenase [Verrucomicrobia bacterium]|nr:2OG-Fe(II) oxygenase [Verrucomicrobiota bacterium]